MTSEPGTALPEALHGLDGALRLGGWGDRAVAERPAVGVRQAAVLALFAVTDEGPDLTVTERSHRMRKHAGQVAFPGGSVDDTDADVVEAALREGNEEIGLQPDSVRILGALPAAHVAVSGFDVTTVVGWWERPHRIWAVDRNEVESVHRIQISHLVDPANRATAIHPSGYRGPAFLADDLFIWGLTAHFLDGLLGMGGWEREWDHDHEVEIPERFLRDTSRTATGTDPNTH